MVKAQFLSLNRRQLENFTSNDFSNFISIGTFDYNIIDLTDDDIYDFDAVILDPNHPYGTFKDLKLINKSIEEYQNSKIIFFLPQNFRFRSDYIQENNISENTEQLLSFLVKAFPVFEQIKDGIQFENSLTEISDHQFKSDFVFSSNLNKYAITRTIGTNKITTIMIGNCIFTTLVPNPIVIEELIKYFPSDDLEPQPSWAGEIKILNDEKIEYEKKSLTENIAQSNERIKVLDKELSKNTFIKSSLWAAGNQLVNVVYKMVQEIFNADLSGFKDVMEADFAFSKNDCHIVGEIKGTNTNVNNSHISKTENHRQEYIVELTNKKIDFNESDIYGILIINHQADKKISERVHVDKKQIDYAKRFKILIIETTTMIKLYERHLNGNLTTEEAILLIKNNLDNGILEIEQ